MASSKPVTAILQGASQQGWITETQLRAEYTRWAADPNVVPALRGMSSNKDEPKMVGWEAAGLKYFYTAVSSDYRFAGSMYAPAASGDEVLGRTNALGLYFHQLITQLAADNSWAWQTAIGKVNWALVDQWATTAKAKGKKIVWTEPSHAWDEVKKNTTAMSYFTKWKDTIVVSYGTNFPDQVDTWARPGATAVASAAGSLKGASVQGFNFTDQSQAVTRAGVAALASTALSSGSTYVEFSGASADLQPGSQLLLGAQDFLGAAVPPPADPRPEGQPYTAILTGGMATDAQDRATYAAWDGKPLVRAAFRGTSNNPDDGVMAGWESSGYRYYWTAASSEFEGAGKPQYVAADAPARVLARANNQGLYLHEVITRNAAVRTSPLWNWAQAVDQVNWDLLERWVKEARAQKKQIIWSEPSHAWIAVFNSAAARARLRAWSDTLVISYGTNFADQVNGWSKPGAVDLASKTGVPLGANLESTNAQPGCAAAVPAGTATALGDAAIAAGATYFSVGGCRADLQPAAAFLSGISTFLDKLASKPAPPGLVPSAPQKVAIYLKGDNDVTAQRLVVDDPSYWEPWGILFYVFDRPAPGASPLYELRKGDSDYNYSSDPAEIASLATQGYAQTGVVLGYVYRERYRDTAPIYRIIDFGNALHVFASSTWGRDQYVNGRYGTDVGVAGYGFSNNGNARRVTIYQLGKSSTSDHMLQTSLSNALWWQRNDGWDEGPWVLGRVWDQPVNGAMRLFRRYSSSGTSTMYSHDPMQVVASNYDSNGPFYGTADDGVGYVDHDPTGQSTIPLREFRRPGIMYSNMGLFDNALTTTDDQRSYLAGRGYSEIDREGYVSSALTPYGGADGVINTDAEADAFFTAYFAASDSVQDDLLSQVYAKDDTTAQSDYTEQTRAYFLRSAFNRLYDIKIPAASATAVGELQNEDGSPLSAANAASASALKCRTASDGTRGERRIAVQRKAGGSAIDVGRLSFKVGFCWTASTGVARPNATKPFWSANTATMGGLGKLGFRILYGYGTSDANTRRTVKTIASGATSTASFEQEFKISACNMPMPATEAAISLDPARGLLTNDQTPQEPRYSCVEDPRIWVQRIIGKADGSATGSLVQLADKAW